MNPATPERAALATSGIMGLILAFALGGVGALLLAISIATFTLWLLAVAAAFGLFALLSLGGLFVLQPNQAMVLVFLGKYRGTVRKAGWHWVNPFTSKRKVSLRVQNFNTERLKVNDADGNPIEIAAVVVWRVKDTARASFDVESYPQFVQVQSETAVRHIATQYPYDVGAKADGPTLRGSAEEVGRELRQELQNRLAVAGMEVVETRLTHLAYSPEIAGAMLQRQQAAAIIAARQRIAAGAVGIVEQVLLALEKEKIVKLNQDERARMVSSLLIVLTSERGAQPILQTNE